MTGSQVSRKRWQKIGDVLAAHTLMLGESGLFDEAAVAAISAQVGEVALGVPSCGGLIAMLNDFDARLDAQTVAAIAGASRLGRGSADVVATVGRLELREALLALLDDLLATRGAYLTMARQHEATLLAAYQGTEPVQPVPLAHFLGATIAPLDRATGYLERVVEEVNLSPMGALALASTGLAIDRDRISQLLGLERPLGSTFDAVAAVDWLVNAANVTEAAIRPVERFLREVWLWVRTDPASVRFAETTLGSLDDLPQLRAPAGLDSLLAQARTIRLLLQSTRMLAAEYPYGPVIDLELLLDPLLAGVRDTGAFLRDASELQLHGLKINRAHLANRASRSRLTASDLAEFLMLQAELEPAAARKIVYTLVDQLRKRGAEMSGLTPAMIDTAALVIIGREIGIEVEEFSRYLAPRRFIERRKHEGGPAAAAVDRWLTGEEELLAKDRIKLEILNNTIASRAADFALLVRQARAFNPEA